MKDVINKCTNCNSRIKMGKLKGCRNCGYKTCEECATKTKNICPNCYSDLEFLG